MELYFKDKNGRNTVCEIVRNGNVIMATELEKNMGMSVTNTCEEIAQECCEKYGIEPEKLIFIEHYTPASYEGSRESYSRVNFRKVEKESKNKVFGNPSWQHETEESVKQLLKHMELN